MYHFVEDKDFLKRAQASCTADLKQVVSLLLEEGISSQIILVGSGARNMVIQNENGNIDFDYNLLIQKCEDIKNCRFLKESVRKAYNKVMRNQKLDDVQDSTSSLTTKKMHFKVNITDLFMRRQGIIITIDIFGIKHLIQMI